VTRWTMEFQFGIEVGVGWTLPSGAGCTIFNSWHPMGAIVLDSTKVGVLDTRGGLGAIGLQQIADGTSWDDK